MSSEKIKNYIKLRYQVKCSKHVRFKRRILTSILDKVQQYFKFDNQVRRKV